MPTKNDKTSVRESTNIVYPFLEQKVISRNTPKINKPKTIRDPKLVENWRVADRIKLSTKRAIKLRDEEANKYTIPYIKDKEIRLTTGRYNTGKISTNLLDSIYDSAIRVGIDPKIALGLAGRESTLGIGRGFKKGNPISGTNLMSNWQQITPYLISNNTRDEYNSVVEKYNTNTPMTKEEADKMIKWYDENDKSVASFRHMTEHPIDNALKFYIAGKYNPGDKKHTQMVEEDARILMTDPAIQKWYQEKTNGQMKYGGRKKAEWGNKTEKKDNTNVAPIHREQVFIPATGAMKVMQDARPKFNGIPIASGAIDIVSPEFDLLTGVRGLLNMIKPNKVYANLGNGSNMTMFDGATTTNEAIKQGIKEARDYVRHPVIVETVERNKKLAERISGKPARNMGWFTNGNKVSANTRAEVLQHYIDRPVHIQTSNDLPKGFLGDYTSANTRIRVKSGLSPYDTKRVTFHEGLHHSGYGNFEGGLYDLKAEKLFGIDDYLLGHEAAVNTAELGRIMGLKLGQKYPGLQSFKDMITKYNVDGFDKKFIFDKAILNTPRDYKRFWDALTGKYFTTAGAAATGLNLTDGDKMKCGGRRKAQLGLDIREGGIAIPIANNMWYIHGRKHEDGGVTMGPNNKNGVEVEGGEIVEMIDSNHPSVGRQFAAGGQSQTMRVFSSVPLLRGVSPAQLVMEGANPNKVFKAQEEFKDRNRINDDGTRYEIGGEKKSNSAIRTEEDKKVPARSRAIYSAVDATADYPAWWQAIGLGIGSNFKTMINPDSMNYTVTDSVADAAWRKRLGLSYNDKFLIPNKDGSVRLPRNVEMEIPTDTTMLKKRIAANEKFANQSNIVGEDWQIVQAMMKKDKEALDSLRHTYKTGEPVVINEYAHNNRKLSKNGELIDNAINYKSPLNVMRNYTIQYDPKNKSMNYWDTYDFNEFEWGVPGKPFEIKGNIPLNKAGGIYIKPSKRGTFTAAAKKRGMGVQEFASKVLANKENYSSAMVKKANFARNAGRWKKKYGGNMVYTINGNVKNGLMSIRPKAEWGKEKKINSTTKQTQARLIGQFKPISVGDWIGLGTNVIGSLASYFINKYLINRLPMPQKPVMAPTVKLKSRHNIEPQLTESREAELSDIAAVERNVASSNVAVARRQRISNRARQERAGYYGQKENVETQLINQDRLNRQTVIGRNVAAYNDWLNRVANMKLTQSSMRSSNINNLISGLAGGVGDMLSRIENRRATNNALRAYAAANPNVDARIIGGFDYYRDAQGRKYDKNGRLIG